MGQGVAAASSVCVCVCVLGLCVCMCVYITHVWCATCVVLPRSRYAPFSVAQLEAAHGASRAWLL